MIILRDYQERGINEIHNHFRAGHKSALYNLATGGGKTVVGGSIIHRTQQKGKKCLFLCNRIELVDQTIKTFRSLGIDAAIIASGYTPDYRKSVQIGSIDTVRTRLDKIPYKPDLIIWDEARSIHAAGWAKIYRYYPDAYHIGLDATPERADGKPLGDFFSKIIYGPSIQELIAMGSLVAPRVYAPNAPDLAAVTTKFGDYETDSLAEAMNKPVITGSAIEHYLKIGENRSGIVFCVNIKHSKQVAEEFKAAGVNAWHVDGETDKSIREWILRKYRAGEIKILCNVGLFCAGLDVPRVGYIASLRPTQSVALYLQSCGRGSRPDDGKTDYILCDHAGNVHRHGLPHEDREWSLEGRKRGGKKKSDDVKAVDIKQCPKCFLCHTPANSCPECGHVYVVATRELAQEDGELKEIDIENFKLRKRAEEWTATSYEDYLKIEVERGYRSGWAKLRWKFSKKNPENRSTHYKARA